MLRILSAVHAYTRECQALEADISLGSDRVLEALIDERGRPEGVRLDNAPEFTSRRIVGWAEERKVDLVHIQPGRPMQNGHVETFLCLLRDECFNTRWLRTLGDVRQRFSDWQQEYNHERLHSSLDCAVSSRFSRSCIVSWTFPVSAAV
jgi:putative transposase